MARIADDDDDDELDDAEAPDVSERDADDGEEPLETVACPHCRRQVYEDAELCTHCGSYISREDAPARYPLWFLIGVILALLVLLFWVFK